MQNHHNRDVTISKTNLIEKLEENKKNHILEYEKAVEDYRTAAIKLLKKATKELREGSLKISISLVTPINRAEEYDKVIEMFKWEVSDTVELTQYEFNEYVHDQTQEAINAKISNSFYSAQFN